MRLYDEFEQLIYVGGDLLFSCVLTKTGTREKALEIISHAAEEYLESRKKLKNENERYRLLALICERKLEDSLSGEPLKEHLTDDEREKLLVSAKLYIASGGRSKKVKSTVIFVAIAIIVIALIIISAIIFFYSEEFRSGAAGSTFNSILHKKVDILL